MAALSQFLPLVAPFAPGAPDAAISAAARYAAIEFCARTLVLQRTMPDIASVADQAAYTPVQSGECIAKLLSVKFGGEPLELLDFASADDLPGDTTSGETQPAYATLSAPMQITLYAAPTVSDTVIKVRGAMQPALLATAIDDGLFERYALVMAHAAVARLLGNPKAAYFDAQGSLTAWAQFMEGVGRAKVGAYYSNARSRPRSAVRWC